jgi:hypothetical protein
VTGPDATIVAAFASVPEAYKKKNRFFLATYTKESKYGNQLFLLRRLGGLEQNLFFSVFTGK